MNALEYRFHRTAQRLAGRPVEIRWRKPYIFGFDGQACKTTGGKAVILIRPDLEERALLHVFCHECAHVKKHFHRMTPSDGHYSPEWSVQPAPAEYKARRAHPVEREADDLAARWQKFALEHFDPHARAGFLDQALDALYDRAEQLV